MFQLPLMTKKTSCMVYIALTNMTKVSLMPTTICRKSYRPNKKDCQNSINRQLNCQTQIVRQLNCQNGINRQMNCQNQIMRQLNCQIKTIMAVQLPRVIWKRNRHLTLISSLSTRMANVKKNCNLMINMKCKI